MHVCTSVYVCQTESELFGRARTWCGNSKLCMEISGRKNLLQIGKLVHGQKPRFVFPPVVLTSQTTFCVYIYVCFRVPKDALRSEFEFVRPRCFHFQVLKCGRGRVLHVGRYVPADEVCSLLRGLPSSLAPSCRMQSLARGDDLVRSARNILCAPRAAIVMLQTSVGVH